MQRETNASHRTPPQRVAADYAMALDLLAQINLLHTEGEVIQHLLNVFIMLFAPREISLVRYSGGEPVAVHQYGREESGPDGETLSLCGACAASRQVIARDQGLTVPLDFSGERMGLIFVSHFAVPDRIGSYRNLIESITPICSLSLNNARNYELVLKNLKFRERLLSIVSHDLRGPLGSMSSVLKMLAEETRGSISGSAENMLAEVIRASDNIVLLLHNLLEWAKVQGDAASTRTVSVDLHLLTRSVFAILQGTASEKDVVLLNEVPEDMELLTDTNALHTVLRNLVSNAVKFSSAGGTVRVTATRRQDSVAVDVSDAGTGMDPVTLQNARLVARRIVKTGTRGERGAGLGLMLCHDLVTKMGDRLEFQSEIGKGTTASLTITG